MCADSSEQYRRCSWHARTLVVLLLASAICTTALSAVWAAAWAAAPAGTTIRNQASASYLEVDGRRVTVTSNIVETLIEQVGGFTLVGDVQRRVAIGGSAQLPHRIVNTGNGDDSFALDVLNLDGDNIDLDTVQIYPDVDRNGVADNASPIVETPTIVAGGSFDFVVRGVVPVTAVDGSIARLQVTASSVFAPALVESNTDTVTAGSNAAVSVSKSLSSVAGVSPSGPWRVTLSYANEGTQAAGDLILIDALPAGMSYVPGSASWSAGSVTPTDAGPADTHAGGGASLVWCAYDTSCTGLAEASTDTDSDSSNQVTAIIDFVSAGSSGSVSFDVTIDPDLSPVSLINQAEYEFDVATGSVPRQLTNAATFTVLASHAVVANGSNTSPINFLAEPVSKTSASAGGKVQFSNIIWNTGNATDTYNIEVDSAGSTFPENTLWRLLRADGATPLLDSNGDGRVDTGPVTPGAFSTVVMELTLPVEAIGNNEGLGFDIQKTARSISDSRVFDAIVDHLDAIVPAAVDLTNQAAAGAVDALGVGAGPETEPVSSVGLDNNGEARFDLYIAHSGELPTRYELSASSTPEGSELSPGWQLRFEDPVSGADARITEPLVTGSPAHVVAVVTPPVGTPSGTVSVYFTAQSPDGNSVDIKHDAVIIDAFGDVRLAPELSAQLEPGGVVVYTHTLYNDGNAALDDVSLATSDSLPEWSTVLWLDSDNDGVLSPGDTQITGNLSLPARESRVIFARVFAPAKASLAAENRTTITATWNAGVDSVSIVDRSRVTRTHVDIVKTQARDTGCDGSPDPGESFTVTPIEIAPGDNCVIYRLVATNKSKETSYNVAILDYTPTFTVYEPGASCSRTPCWMVMPAPGTEGALSATTDQLVPGESYWLEFSVRVL